MDNKRRDFLWKAAVGGLSLPLISFKSQLPAESVSENPIIRPPALKAGDLIAISSPAGAVWDAKQVDVFEEILRKFGFRVRRGNTLNQKYGYFSGTDEARADELNRFFADPEIKAIFCMKGGWGCARLLPRLDYGLIRNNPKVIMGFSDITSLLIAIQAKTGLVTFHGPVGNSGWNDFSSGYVQRVLMQKEKVLYTSTGKEEDKPLVLYPGQAKGVLMGGNLSVLAGIIGSEYLPQWKDKILFLEETGEEPYRIDRMLTQLKLAGVLDSISGFIFGKCVKCLAEEPEKAFTLREVLEQQISTLKIPAFYGAMIGHIENKYTLPLGIKAGMDAGTGHFELLEEPVS